MRDGVQSLIAQMAPVQDAKLSGSANLTVDLGYDSLRLMELAAALEDRFGIGDIREDDAAELETVAEVEELVLRMLGDQRVP